MDVVRSFWREPEWNDNLVQILVVIANSQLETLAAEVEKGSLRIAFGQRLLGPKFLVTSV